MRPSALRSRSSRKSRPRRVPHQELRDVTGLVTALRNLLAAEHDGSSGETLRGQIAGAESHDPVMLPCDPADGSRKFQAGFLAGHLYAYLIREFGTLRGTFLVPAAAYAASLVSPQAERHLAELPPLNLLRTHRYACLRVEERQDLPQDLEFAACRWLAVQLSVPIVPELEARVTKERQRRQELLAERAMERTADPAAGTARRIERRLAEHAEALQRQLADLGAASTEAERLRGALVGLELDSGSGLPGAGQPFERLVSDQSEAYRGGMLGASLLATLVREDRVADDTLRRHAYRYGAVLASASGRAFLGEAPPRNVLKAHLLAVHNLVARAGEPLEEDLEIAMLRWLADQAGLTLTPELVEQRRMFVVKPNATPDSETLST
jgi:hypothetical protein